MHRKQAERRCLSAEVAAAHTAPEDVTAWDFSKDATVRSDLEWFRTTVDTHPCLPSALAWRVSRRCGEPHTADGGSRQSPAHRIPGHQHQRRKDTSSTRHTPGPCEAAVRARAVPT